MKCTTADYKPGFPSGQRGWTQDPLRKASQVRILPPAPFSEFFEFFFRIFSERLEDQAFRILDRNQRL